MSASRAVKRQPQLEESESDAEMIVTQEEAKPVVHRSDEDHDSDEEVEQSLGSKRRRLSNQPNGKQRAKRSGRHDVDSEEDEDDQQPQKEEDKDPDDNMAEAELQRAIAAFRMPQRNRDADGFQEGAVVRVKCHNFLTYSDVEVRPGPYLNMILGPNGTGKSTIVSAISIAVGTKAKDLKRHEKVNGMIKYGAQEGFVEVELKGKPGRQNTIIRRDITVKNAKSDWKLNGRKSTEEDVLHAVADLNVQTDNLVCYLPQELVYEFAKMSGSQLLRATEKSAGHRDLPQWHDQLTEIKRQWMQNVAEINTDRELLQREEETQAKCRREEERLKQRENCERELAFLTVMLHYKTYFDRKTQYDSLKEAERRGKQRIAQLKRELQPFTTEQTNMVKRVEELDKALKETKEATDKCTTQIRRKKDQVGQAEARTRQTRENLEALQGAAQTRAESIKKCETNIKHHEAVLERGPPAAADVSEEIARLEAIAVEQAQIREAYLSIQENQNAWTAERDDYTREKNQAEAEVTRLQDSARQREMKMQNEDKGTYAALQWIRQNHDRLKGKVYDPVRLAITPTKPEYAKYLDACINQHTTRTILCEKEEDYDLLSKSLNDHQDKGGLNLRVTLGMLDENTRQLDDFRKAQPWNDDQLQSQGFDMWALDMAQGPEQVLRFLCNNSHLHEIPIQCRQGAQAIDENTLQHRNSPIRRYIANGLHTTFNFSKYGRREAFSSSTQLRSSTAVAFTSGVDEEAVQKAREEVTKWQDRIQEVKKRLLPTREESVALYSKNDQLKAEKEEVMKTRKGKEAIKREYDTARTKLQGERKSLDRLLSQPSQEEKRKECMNSLKTQAARRLALVHELQNCSNTLMSLRQEQTGLDLVHLHVKANVEAIKAEQTGRNLALKEAQNELAGAIDASKKAHNEARVALDQYSAANEDYDGEWETDKTAWEEAHPDMTTDEIETLQMDKDAELSAAPEISPEVIRQIRHRDQRIRKLKEALEVKQTANGRLETRITNIERKYKPIIMAVVKEVNDKFSNAFDVMGCAGEVLLDDSDADPESWAIKIMVSFRKNTQLVELTGQRQSGGERSLTTIMYLISLTKVSTAPFSLVDEINQGMDARNERAILDLLVKCTCEEDASQYFLITPKLLPHLRYHEKMKILCIQNGDWLPEEEFTPRKWLKAVSKKERRPLLSQREA